MDSEHKICELERQIAVLEQKSKDDDKALVLARDVVAARWASAIAVIVASVSLLVAFIKR